MKRRELFKALVGGVVGIVVGSKLGAPPKETSQARNILKECRSDIDFARTLDPRFVEYSCGFRISRDMLRNDVFSDPWGLLDK